jgi:hypothetical protein
MKKEDVIRSGILERWPDLTVEDLGSNTAICHPEYPSKRLVISDNAGPTIIYAFTKKNTMPIMLAYTRGKLGEPRSWRLIGQDSPEGTELTEAGMWEKFINWLTSAEAS